jgi:hypothetical protein
MNETFKYPKYNILRSLNPAFKKGMLYIRPEDHKIGMKTAVMWNTPWIHAGKDDPDRNCVLFHQIMLPHCNFIPSRCQECWKVVARPNTVSQLFKISALQHESDRDSKAGIELRSSVGGNYGAYWYNDSIEEGDECRQYVRGLCDKNGMEDVKVFLKRGCTEFEHQYGSSIDWGVTEEALEIEQAMTDAIVIDDPGDRAQPDYLVEEIQMRWIEFAHERGDKTYLEFTDGKPLYPAYVTYQSNPLKEAA